MGFGLDNRRSFYGIQILRGAAASLVVAFHAAYNLQESGGFHALRVPYFGNGGVDLFFLISGFVIVWTTKDRWNRPGEWSNFLEKRLKRIFPLYWLLTTMKLAGLILAPYLFRDSTTSVWHVIASYLLIPAWNGAGGAQPIITQGWTLCYEMLFYYACTLCLVLRVRPAFTITPIFIILAIIGCFRTPEWGAVATLLDPLLLEFVVGMWVAEWARFGWHGGRTAPLLLVVAGCAGLLASDLLSIPTEYAFRVVFWGIPALAILLGFVALESKVDFSTWRMPRVIGDASYSIYLTHAFTLAPIMSVLRRHAFGPLGQWGAFAGGTLFAILLGVVAYYVVEKPLLRISGTAAKLLRERWLTAAPGSAAS